jgi:hypothetical protein
MHQQGDWRRKFGARQCPHFSCVHTDYLDFVERCEMPAVLSSTKELTAHHPPLRSRMPSGMNRLYSRQCCMVILVSGAIPTFAVAWSVVAVTLVPEISAADDQPIIRCKNTSHSDPAARIRPILMRLLIATAEMHNKVLVCQGRQV